MGSASCGVCRASPGPVSRHGSIGYPPCAESPFAPSECYPSRSGVNRPLGRHYPSLIATTGSCAKPNPSPLPPALASSGGLCRLLPAPAGRWLFPALSPQSLHRCLDPYPAAPLWCTCPFLPKELRPHPTLNRFGAPDSCRNATSTAWRFRGCSQSVMFRLPCSLDPQVAPTA